MGHKGVSKRKPKGSKSFSNDHAKDSNTRPGASSSVQSVVNGKDASLNNGSPNSYTGSNKKNKKGK